jgi:hypothetical protein
MIRALVLAAASTIVVHFTGGRAVIERIGEIERVRIEQPVGTVTSESECDAQSGRYAAIVAFGERVKAASARRDRTALASLMQYPLRVNTGPNRGYTVATRSALLARAASVFPAGTLSALARMEPHDVFCREGMSMFAQGTLWAQADRTGRVRGAIVNR